MSYDDSFYNLSLEKGWLDFKYSIIFEDLCDFRVEHAIFMLTKMLLKLRNIQ